MLMPRTLRRRRIWRDFYQSMATIMGMSIILCIYGTVFRAATNPAARPPADDSDSASASTNYGERIIHYGEEDATSVNVQRHNRALQFMDSKKFGSAMSESKEGADMPGLQENNRDFPKDSSLINQRTTSDQFHSKNSALNLSRPSPHFEPPTTSSVASLHQSDSGNAKKVLGSKPSQLKIVTPSLSEKNIHSRLNLNRSEPTSKRLPQAIIIGAKKSGTRALLEFLRLHPLVEGTGPEPHFFDRNYNKGLQWYREHMPETRNHQMTIEKTPGYFVTRDAPRRIFEMNPSIKLILVVRDPVTRAISDYCQAVSKHAMKPFEEMALLDEHLGLVNTSWGAIRIGVYAKHMERWLQVFSLSQIHLVDGQKLIEEPAREVAKVETFLGLPKFINDSHFYLRGFKGTFPCLIRDGKPHCLDEKSKGRDHPVVKDNVIQRLRDFFRPFNAKFYQMVGRNFEWS